MPYIYSTVTAYGEFVTAHGNVTGHILRMENTPPQLAMSSYYTKDASGTRGRPKSTLVLAVKSDLTRLGIRLECAQNLADCRQLAQDRGARKQNA